MNVVVEAMGIPTTFALLLVLLLEVGYHKATVNLLLRIYMQEKANARVRGLAPRGQREPGGGIHAT